jgi:hypothetical protein
VKVLAALALLGLALPASGAGATANPCKVVTAADAAKVLGGKVAPGKAQSLGLFQSCFYNAGTKSVTVQTRQIAKADFVTSAKANPGPVVAVPGLGAAAYSAAGGSTLLVWKNGTEVTLLAFGVSPAMTAEKALAKSALARL